MSWISELFGLEKPIVAMCHLRPLPGDPKYDATLGMESVIAHARADLRALQDGGVDAVMFSNEFSLPYMLQVEPITGAAMARVIGELRAEIRVPYGVNILWDPKATIELAVATGAQFVREVFSGVYASDYGLWSQNAGELIRLRKRLGGESIRIFYNIVPESAVYLGDREFAAIAQSTEFNCEPDVLCVSGLVAGEASNRETLRTVKQAVKRTPVFSNTGMNAQNIGAYLSIADGAVVGTTFKRDSYIWNEVDSARVAEFMRAARTARAACAEHAAA